MAKRRRMSQAEAAIKKRLFANYILDTRERKTKDEICAELDIPASTYDQWAKDPAMVEWAGIEPWRYSEGARHFLRAHQATALRTLLDVMQNSTVDMARVRAAETFLASAEGVRETKQDATAEEVVKLLTSRSPTLFIGNVNFLKQTAPPESIEVVDAQTRLLTDSDDA